MKSEVIEAYRQPDNFGSRLLGIVMEECSETRCTVSLTLSEKHMNAMDITHGGVVFTLMDVSVGTISAYRGTISVTLNSSVSFTAPSSTGKIYAKAELLNATYRTSLYRSTVYDENGKILASGQFTMYLKNYKKN